MSNQADTQDFAQEGPPALEGAPRSPGAPKRLGATGYRDPLDDQRPRKPWAFG